MKRKLRKLTALLLMFAMIFTFVGNSKTTLAANGGSGVQNVNFETLFLALEGTPYESLEITMTGDEGDEFTASSTNQILHNVPYDRYTFSVMFNDEELEGFTLRYRQQGATILVLTDNVLIIDNETPTAFFVSITLAAVYKGTLKVEKVDDSGNPLANVTFELTKGSLTQSVTTNSAGIALFENLSFGDYELTETSAPEGYLFNEDPIDVEISGVETVTKRITNELIRGTVKVTKYDDDENLLEGAEFTLTDGDYTRTATTDSFGTATFEDVPYGEYDLSETEAPEGYTGSSMVETVVIDESGEELEFEFINSLITGTVKVTKYDDDENLLEGAEFTLTDGDYTRTATTDSEGTAIFEDVPYGEYDLSETEAPEGYTGSSVVEEVVIDEAGEELEFEFINSLITGTVKVTKYDDDENLLEGAEFTLTDGDYTRTATTDSEGVAIFEDVPYGEYELLETEAPEGYTGSSTVETVVIDEAGEELEFEFINSLITGTVKVTKYDDDENLLEGAEFTLTDGDYTRTATTDSEGVAIFEDVPYGGYELSETEAPEGYTGSSTVEIVVIDEAGEELEFEFINSLITGTVKVTKYDDDENLLEGAIFELSNNDYEKMVTTDSNGEAIFEDVPYGEYELSEISAPAGYIKETESYDVEIKEVNDIVEISVVNKAIRGNILIVKTDDDGEPLQGAEIALYRDGIAIGKVLETDDDGEVLFEDVLYGTYEIRETKAPEGYVLTDVTYEVKVDEDGETVSLEIRNSLISSTILIKKVEKGTVTGLNGAEFVIEDEEGGVVFTGTTGNDGTLSVILPYGKYIIEESKSPEGYMLDEKSYSVDIKENGQIFNILVENEKILEEEEVDSKDEETDPDDEEEGSLPQTGGIPSELLYAVGMMAMAGGVVLMRKKENE